MVNNAWIYILLLGLFLLTSLSAYITNRQATSASNFPLESSESTTLVRLPPKFNIEDMNSLVDPDIECHTVPATHPLTVCVHDGDDNMANCMRKGGHWEQLQTDHLTRVFDAHPSASFLDMGANVGYFALFYAGQGKRVVALEPSRPSVERIKAGAQRMGVTDQITVLRNAVSDGRVVEFRNFENALRSSVIDKAKQKQEGVKPEQMETFESVTLNDMLHLDLGEEVVIKLDIEQQEVRALHAAADLFAKRHVLIVTVEVMGFTKKRAHTDAIWEFFNSRGYRMFSDRGKEIFADTPRETWTWDVWFVSPRCQECIPLELPAARNKKTFCSI